MASEAKPLRNHLISRRKFRDFVAGHPGTERDIETFMAWSKNVERTHWGNFGDVRASFPHADLIGDLVCFNLGGNKYRVLAKIRYRDKNATDVLIQHVMTHREYDTLK